MLHTLGARNKVGGLGDSRCTPEAIWMPALKGTNIETWDLDPATNSFSTVPAIKKWKGIKNDGLKLKWAGNVWLNCPFSSMTIWSDKVFEEFERGDIESLNMLTPTDPSVEWYKKLVRNSHAFATMAKRHHCPTPGNLKGSPGGGLTLFFWDFRDGPVSLDRWEKVHRHVGCLTYRYRTV